MAPAKKLKMIDGMQMSVVLTNPATATNITPSMYPAVISPPEMKRAVTISQTAAPRMRIDAAPRLAATSVCEPKT